MGAHQTKAGKHARSASGFTLVELAIVIAILCFLAAILLPTLLGAKSYSQGERCIFNTKQLMIAALQYADDNKGLWLPNQPYGTPSGITPSTPETWTTVLMDWGTFKVNGGYVATNWQWLITPPTAPAAITSGFYSLFTPYISNPLYYKCPSDTSVVQGAGPRVRTYSGSQAVGTCWVAAPGFNTYSDGPVTGQWLNGSDDDAQTYGFCYQQVSQMIHPPPAKLMIFCEEHPDSINDWSFAAQIANYGLGGDFIDCPGNLHAGSAGFSFADGHAQLHRWQGSILGKARFLNGSIGEGSGGPFSYAFPNTTALQSGDLKDLNWLQSHTSYPRNAVIAKTFPVATDP